MESPNCLGAEHVPLGVAATTAVDESRIKDLHLWSVTEQWGRGAAQKSERYHRIEHRRPPGRSG